ncbi:hypothetical protein MXB_2092, partial [Myxobolus squamalis]
AKCKSDKFFVICHPKSVSTLPEDFVDLKVTLTFQENAQNISTKYFQVKKLNNNTEYFVPAYNQDDNILILYFDLPKKAYKLLIVISDEIGTPLFEKELIDFDMTNFPNIEIKAQHVDLLCFACCTNCIKYESPVDWQQNCPTRCEMYPEGCRALYHLYVKHTNLVGEFLIRSDDNLLFKTTDSEVLQNGIVFPLYSDSVYFILKKATPHRYVVHYYTYPSETEIVIDISLLMCVRRDLNSKSCDLANFQSRMSSRKNSRTFLPLTFGDSTLHESIILDIHIREYLVGELNENTDSVTLHLPSNIFSGSLPFEFCVGSHCLKILPDPFILPDDKHEIELRYAQHYFFTEPKILFCHIFEDPYCSSRITPDENGTITLKIAKKYSVRNRI